MLTYRRVWVRRFYLNSYIAALNGKRHKPQTKMSNIIAEEVKCVGEDKKAFYKSKIAEFWNKEMDGLNIDDPSDLAFVSHSYDTMVHNAFIHETKHLLQFLMIASQNSLLI